MSEVDYTRLTCDFTLAAAPVLARLNPGIAMINAVKLGAPQPVIETRDINALAAETKLGDSGLAVSRVII